jgi:hypothetical protein
MHPWYRPLLIAAFIGIPGLAQTPQSQTDPLLCSFWSQVKDSIAKGDIHSVSALIHFPVGVEIKRKNRSLSKNAFLQNFNKAISPEIKNFILQSDCAEFEQARSKWVIGKGSILIWVDEFYVNNDPKSPTEFKICAIWPHGVLLPKEQK